MPMKMCMEISGATCLEMCLLGLRVEHNIQQDLHSKNRQLTALIK